MPKTTEQHPILVVDFKELDRERIKHTLRELKLDCTDEQAEQLRVACSPLPRSDNKLIVAITQYVRIDFAKAGQTEDEVLRELYAEWDEQRQNRPAIERRMMIATDGMAEHPEWWNHPCLCDLCRSYS